MDLFLIAAAPFELHTKKVKGGGKFFQIMMKDQIFHHDDLKDHDDLLKIVY